MEDVLDLTVNLRNKGKKYSEQVVVLVGCNPNESPADVFGMISNNLKYRGGLKK